MADISVLVQAEVVRPWEAVYGASRFVASQNTLSAGLRENALKATDSPTSQEDLFTSKTETIRVRDFVLGAARNTQLDRAAGLMENPLHLTGAGVVELIDVVQPRLHITDGPVQAAIGTVAFDAAATSGYQATLGSYTFAHTVGSFSNRALVVSVSLFTAGSVSAITYDGVAATFVRADTVGLIRSEIWALAAPNTGTHNVAVTFSVALTSVANAQSYYNANQSGPVDAHNGATGTNTPASAAVSIGATLDTVVGILTTQTASGVTSDSGQTNRASTTGALGTSKGDDAVDVVVSDTFIWNNIGTVDSWAVSLVALQPPEPDVLLTETLKIADTVLVTLDPLQAGPAESLKIADTVTPALFLSATPSTETLKLADTPTEQLDPLQVLVTTEALKVADTSSQTEDPLQAIQTETIKITDGPVTAGLFLNATPPDETLKLADTVSAQLNPLQILISGEALKLADTATVAEDPLQATPTEAIKITDGPVTAGIFLNATPADEVLKLAETVSASEDPLQAGPSETCKLADGPAVPSLGGNLAVLVTAESLKVVDANNGIVQLIGVLHIQDGPPLVALVFDLGITVTQEALKLADTSSAQEDPLLASVTAEALKLADTPTVSENPLQAGPAESAKVSDTVTPSEDPLETSATETCKLADGPALTAIVISATPSAENVHVVDTVTVSENPEQAAPTDQVLKLSDGPASVLMGGNLAVLVSETCKLSDSGLGKTQLIGVLHITDGPATAALANQLSVGVTAETVKLSEELSTLEGLAVAVPTETVILSDKVFLFGVVVAEERVVLSDTGRGTTSLIGTFRITDGPVQANLGDLLHTSADETLKLSDTAQAVRTPLEASVTETLKIAYVASEVEYTQDEYLALADLVYVDLTIPTDLSTFVTQESCRVLDTVTARRDLEVAATVEAVRLADTVVVSRWLEATQTEVLKLSDTAAVVADESTNLAEALRVSDGPAAGQLDLLLVSVAEALKVSDEVSAFVGNDTDLVTSLQPGILRLADVVTAARGLDVSLTEPVLLAEELTVGFGQPLDAVVADEGVRLGDSAAGGVTPLMALPGTEALKLSDSAVGVYAIPVVVTGEHVAVGEDLLQVAMDLSIEIPGPEPEPVDAIAIADEALGDPMFTEETWSAVAFADERLRADSDLS